MSNGARELECESCVSAAQIKKLAASHDVRGGGTGREFLGNILSDRCKLRSKWYAVLSRPTDANSGGAHCVSGTITLAVVTLATARHVVRVYTFRSAGDCPDRDPSCWTVHRGCAATAPVFHALVDQMRMAATEPALADMLPAGFVKSIPEVPAVHESTSAVFEGATLTC